MGRVYEGIDERLASWIARQPLFFVGTAPEAPERESIDGLPAVDLAAP